MDSALSDSDFVAFVATARPDEARAFYVDTLGLELVGDEPQALILRGNGRYLRIQKVNELPRSIGTVLGWMVKDIESKVRQLSSRGISFQRYEGLPQDDNAIATFPNGDKVAWFLDPDGNVLSLAELSERE
jgi:catechol 2,3-dioxygenase-like lactoylglutathione lyase family enzyme